MSTNKKDDDEDGGKGGDAETRRKANEADARAAEREAKAAARERRADLRGALRDAGCPRDDLDDALALLDRAVGSDYDDDELDDEVEALKTRRPALFGDDDDPDGDDDSREKKQKRPARGNLPAGRGGRRKAAPAQFGAAGLDRAKRKGWVKDSK